MRQQRVQSVWSVCLAECSKLLSKGGVRGWIIASGVLGLAMGFGTIAFAHLEELQTILQLSVSEVASSGPLMVMLTLTIAMSGFVSREVSDGTIGSSRYLVPATATLFAGRLLSWIVVSTVVGLIASIPPTILALLDKTVMSSGVIEVLACLIISVLVCAMTLALVHSGALILKRGAYIVAVGLTLLLILPMLLALASLLLPTTASIANAASKGMVGSLIGGALSVPANGEGSWNQTFASLGGLSIWMVVVAAMAYRRLSRTGYGEK